MGWGYCDLILVIANAKHATTDPIISIALK